MLARQMRNHVTVQGRARRSDGWLVSMLAAVAAWVLLLASFAATAQGASGWTAYAVTDSASGGVLPIDTATGAAGTTIDGAGQYPDAIALTPDGQTAYVADYYGEVTPIDLATGAAEPSIENVGTYPVAIAMTPNGQTAYVVNEGSGGDGTVVPIDLASGEKGAAITVGPKPGAIAIAPDGQTAYVANYAGESITPIDLSSGQAETPIHVGVEPIAIAIAPDGRTAYVANQGSGSGDNGNVTPIDLATGQAGSAVPVGTDYPEGLAMAPNGQTVYVTDYDGSVTPIDTANDEAQTPIVLGEELHWIAITPDSGTAYVTNFPGTKVTPIDLTDGKAGTSITGSDLGAIAIAPDQAPQAAFSLTAAPSGSPSSFDASSSSSAVGSIVSYQWSFGDGQSATTTSPTTSHVYATPGVYTVSLTVTDSAGTSLAQVFTGQTMSLDGGPQATATHTVTITATPTTSTTSMLPTSTTLSAVPTVTQATQSHTIWREGDALASFARKQTKDPPIGTTFSFTLNESAHVSFAFTHKLAGRKAKSGCVAQSRKNARKPACTRTATAAILSFAGHAGINKVSFQGRVSTSRKLAPGHYTLLIVATATGEASRTVHLSFTIAGA
jgi:DNA-binding beta-propeller fold protein YncE